MSDKPDLNEPFTIHMVLRPSDIHEELNNICNGAGGHEQAWDYVHAALDVLCKYELLNPDGYRVYKYLNNMGGE